MNESDKFWSTFVIGVTVFGFWWYAPGHHTPTRDDYFVLLALWAFSTLLRIGMEKYRRGLKELANKLASGEINPHELAARLKALAPKD